MQDACHVGCWMLLKEKVVVWRLTKWKRLLMPNQLQHWPLQLRVLQLKRKSCQWSWSQWQQRGDAGFNIMQVRRLLFWWLKYWNRNWAHKLRQDRDNEYDTQCYLQNFLKLCIIQNLKAPLSPDRAKTSAPMDIVSCHVSDHVNSHQCSQSSRRFQNYSSGADTQSVVQPHGCRLWCLYVHVNVVLVPAIVLYATGSVGVHVGVSFSAQRFIFCR